MLTIAIPTYNRAVHLQAQIEGLLPQLRPGVRLCIYDNASSDETQEMVGKYLCHGISYFRAAQNCGGGRNFFWCLQECQTEWLWILADDDPAAPDAVANLLELLSRSTSDFIHLSSPMWSYESERTVSTVVDIFRYARFSSLLWLSCGIYRTASFYPFFRLFNDSISTMGPQMLVILALLESQRGEVLLSPLHLFQGSPNDVQWSTLDFIIRITQAPEYLVEPVHQQLLAEGILFDWFDSAMLHGLRETAKPYQVRKWYRIYRLARLNLKAYHAKRHWLLHFQNCLFKPERRIESLKMIAKAITIKTIACCPPCFFHAFLKVVPLSRAKRNAYAKREEYVPYGY